MARYKYTNPDVINYRKNQYRLVIWSNVFSIITTVGFFGALAALTKVNEKPIVIDETLDK